MRKLIATSMMPIACHMIALRLHRLLKSIVHVSTLTIDYLELQPVKTFALINSDTEIRNVVFLKYDFTETVHRNLLRVRCLSHLW
jgi:hypothetical protein